jgi:hypothetical protein
VSIDPQNVASFPTAKNTSWLERFSSHRVQLRRQLRRAPITTQKSSAIPPFQRPPCFEFELLRSAKFVLAYSKSLMTAAKTCSSFCCLCGSLELTFSMILPGTHLTFDNGRRASLRAHGQSSRPSTTRKMVTGSSLSAAIHPKGTFINHSS